MRRNRALVELIQHLIEKKSWSVNFLVKFLLVFFLLIFLKIFGIITNVRILMFFIILFIIIVYKLLWRIIRKEDFLFRLNSKSIDILFKYEDIKSILILYIIKIHVLLYDLIIKFNINNKLIKFIIFLLNNLFIYPIIIILNFFYKMLILWRDLSIIQIIFKRSYGLIITVLIFSPILNIIWELLNYNICYIYIGVIILGLIQQLYERSYFEKYFKILQNIRYLKIQLNFLTFMERRNYINISEHILKKELNFCNSYMIKTNSYILWDVAYNSSLGGLIVYINFDKYIICHKLIYIYAWYKKNINPNWVFMRNFLGDLDLQLNDYLELVSYILFMKIQPIYKFSVDELYKLKELEEFLTLIIILLLNYKWCYCYELKLKNTYKELDIGQYNISKYSFTFLEKLTKEDLDNIIKSPFYQIKEQKEFYDYFYILMNISKLINDYINFGKNIYYKVEITYIKESDILHYIKGPLMTNLSIFDTTKNWNFEQSIYKTIDTIHLLELESNRELDNLMYKQLQQYNAMLIQNWLNVDLKDTAYIQNINKFNIDKVDKFIKERLNIFK
jgi:hypothetical protein